MRPPPRLPLLLLPRRQARDFTFHQHPPPASLYTPTETTILTSALRHVPEHGLTTTSLALGARENGYLDISINLFPRGAFELVHFHLVQQRLELRNKVDFTAAQQAGKKLGVGEKIRTLCVERLRANEPIIGRWQEVYSDAGWRCGEMLMWRSIGTSHYVARRKHSCINIGTGKVE
jgi:ubiquinone biosynthesis protein COQ9